LAPCALALPESDSGVPPDEFREAAQGAGALGLVGLIVGIGQLLASTERLTMRIIIGRALSSAGLGASSAALLVWIPELPAAAQLGIAALFASLGTSGLEKLMQRIIKR
jgi:hypothetical protein